jgi:hypothetical protein
MKAQAMKHPIDDIVGLVFGIAGGGIYAKLMGITWQFAWQSLGHIIWIGFIAVFSGAMGVIGKHLATKYLKLKKRTNE